ncbi:hypothetical protein SASPL_100371 [Salvia splendens]|uniref:Uncharacterized protein n=1 Tax=Salvia splendens TaxID=180675 RepID=A0A8X9AA78_SALSN|nr:hypothetical protein SASPL_100371 [Salvia splendens]
MGTEVLYSPDLLAQRLHVALPPFHRRRNNPSQGNLTNLIVNRRPGNKNTNANTNNKKTSPRSEKRKSNESKKATHGGDARRRDVSGGPTVGQVTILRRGQSLSSIAAKLNGGEGRDARSRSPPAKKPAADDMAPEMMPKPIRLSPAPLPDMYAGTAFALSPSPRSLPLPSFFNKKQQDFVKINSSDDPATRDLRRLLRLE